MTVHEFIEKLGGNNAAADMFGVGRTAVCNWKTWGKLPKRLHLRAFKLARERGLDFDPEDAS